MSLHQGHSKLRMSLLTHVKAAGVGIHLKSFGTVQIKSVMLYLFHILTIFVLVDFECF